MANTVVLVQVPPGLTAALKVELYPLDSDTIANTAGGDDVTVATNRLGWGTATVTEAVIGDHLYIVKLGSQRVATGYLVMLDDTEVHEHRESFTASSVIVAGPNPFFTSAGVAAANVTETNTHTDTHERTGNNWILDPDIALNGVDVCTFDFATIAGGNPAISFSIDLSLSSGGSRTIDVQIEDQANPGTWITLITISNTGGLIESYAFDLQPDWTDTGAGLVQFRIRTGGIRLGDSLEINYASVIAIADAGSIPSAIEIAIEVDRLQSTTHGDGSWRGDVVVETVIETVTTQTEFILADGPAQDDILDGFLIVIKSTANPDEIDYTHVLSYKGATRTVTIIRPMSFTVIVGDVIDIRLKTPSIVQSVIGAYVFSQETNDDVVATTSDPIENTWRDDSFSQDLSLTGTGGNIKLIYDYQVGPRIVPDKLRVKWTNPVAGSSVRIFDWELVTNTILESGIGVGSFETEYRIGSQHVSPRGEVNVRFVVNAVVGNAIINYVQVQVYGGQVLTPISQHALNSVFENRGGALQDDISISASHLALISDDNIQSLRILASEASTEAIQIAPGASAVSQILLDGITPPFSQDINADERAINGSQAAAIQQGLFYDGQVTGVVAAAAPVPSKTIFAADPGEIDATLDYYEGSFLKFVTGANVGIGRAISRSSLVNPRDFHFLGATKSFIDFEFPNTPIAGDKFIIEGREGV